MKIVLVNYRYFVSGGPERYLFNIKALLESHGHEIIPFSIKHDKNQPTEYEKYFLSPIGSGKEVYFTDMQKKGFKDSFKGFSRMIYSFEAKRKFKKILQDIKPDLVYILYYQNKISCSIVDAAKSLNIPIIQRISDYSLIAPCSHLYDMHTSEICEKCIECGLASAVKNKCVLNSFVYSCVKTLGVKVQNLLRMPEKIDRFIFPSSFTMSKFIECGYDTKKLVHVPTLFNDETLRKDLEIEYQPFALFIGRTDPDKGMMTLLDTFINTDLNLKIIGFSSEQGFQEQLKDYIKGKKHNIEFLGRMDFYQMQEYLSKCLFTVLPSEWYDNLPNTILESYALKKCVVATNIGSLTENILNEKTGLLFKYKNVEDLKEKVTFLFNNPEKAKEFGENARMMIDTKYSQEIHVKKLLEVFSEVVQNNKKI